MGLKVELSEDQIEYLMSCITMSANHSEELGYKYSQEDLDMAKEVSDILCKAIPGAS
jgi:hypothetical protein